MSDKIDYFNFEKKKIGKPTTLIPVEELESLRSQLTECKAQIEAMKCCGNCSDNKGCTLLPRGQEKCSSWQPKGEKQ
jgi:hypothetical protein